jgi:hypothetical protein
MEQSGTSPYAKHSFPHFFIGYEQVGALLNVAKLHCHLSPVEAEKRAYTQRSNFQRIQALFESLSENLRKRFPNCILRAACYRRAIRIGDHIEQMPSAGAEFALDLPYALTLHQSPFCGEWLSFKSDGSDESGFNQHVAFADGRHYVGRAFGYRLWSPRRSGACGPAIHLDSGLRLIYNFDGHYLSPFHRPDGR